MAIMISSLDQSNPLHLHPNDSNCASICSIKLTGVENYRIWASAMKLAMQIKNKLVFLMVLVLKLTLLPVLYWKPSGTDVMLWFLIGF